MKKAILVSLLLLLGVCLKLKAQFTLTRTSPPDQIRVVSNRWVLINSKESAAVGTPASGNYKSAFRFFLNKGNKGRFGFDENYWSEDQGSVTGLSGIADGTSGVLASEWFTDKFGAWRMSLGSALAAGKDSVEKTYQSFLSGGGNVYLKLATPLLDFSSIQHSDSRYFKIFFAGKAAANIPGVGSSVTDSVLWNLDLGLDFQLKLAGNDNVIALFGIFKTGWAHGSKEFARLVSDSDKRSFGYGAATIGVLVKNTFTIQFNFPVNVFGDLNNQIGTNSPSVSLNILSK